MYHVVITILYCDKSCAKSIDFLNFDEPKSITLKSITPFPSASKVLKTLAQNWKQRRYFISSSCEPELIVFGLRRKKPVTNQTYVLSVYSLTLSCPPHRKGPVLPFTGYWNLYTLSWPACQIIYIPVKVESDRRSSDSFSFKSLRWPFGNCLLLPFISDSSLPIALIKKRN